MDFSASWTAAAREPEFMAGMCDTNEMECYSTYKSLGDGRLPTIGLKHLELNLKILFFCTPIG